MSLPYRHNFKWNINELLSLQREYELLEMNIQDISDKHERTVVAILYRLQQEDLIDTWIDARGYQEFAKTQKYLVGSLDSDINDYGEDVVNNETDDEDTDYDEGDEVEEDCSDDDEDDEDYNDISSLNQRVWGLETAVSDIKEMIGTLLSKFSTPSKPLKKLRQPQLSVEI
jgi:hypothetical protein